MTDMEHLPATTPEIAIPGPGAARESPAVVRLSRLNELSARMLRIGEDDSFTAAVAEALEQIFEVRFSACWRLNAEGEAVGVPRVLGSDARQSCLRSVGSALRAAFDEDVSVRFLDPSEIAALEPLHGLHGGMAGLCCNADGLPQDLVLVGWSADEAPAAGQCPGSFEHAFGLLVAQVGALRESVIDRHAVKRLNEDLVSVLQAIPDLLFEIDARGYYVEIWRSAESLLALGIHRLVGRRIDDVLPAEAARTVRSAFAEADRDGSSFGHLVNLIINDESRWYELSVAVRHLAHGNRNYMMLSRDVTERRLSEEKLKVSEARFRQIFEHVDSIAVQGYDRDRRVFYWNPASERLYGYSSEEALGQPLESLIAPPARREKVMCDIDTWIASGRRVPAGEVELRHANGATVHVLCNHIAMTALDGRQELYCIGVDLSELRNAESRVRLLSQAVEQSPISVVITDTEGYIEYVNGAGCEVSGFTMSELLGQHSRIFRSEQMAGEVFEELWASLEQGRDWNGELLNRKKNGELFWEQAFIAPVLDDGGRCIKYIAVKEDITLRKAQEEKIVRQATYDSLTALPNRMLVLDRLENMVAAAQRDRNPVAVLFLDLDNFKKINDSLGHEVGDEVLVEAARRISRAVRHGDTVGRLGGDEFIVLLRNMGRVANASRVAEAVVAEFRRPFQVGRREMLLTVSVGVALFPNDGDRAGELLRKADTAMYHAKSLGKNTCAFFTDTLNQGVDRRMALEEGLHGALERDELHLCYQPKINLESGSIDGVEALLRWCSPELGEVSPVEFIPVAEQNGQILAIGRFVLETALAQAAAWREGLGLELSVAVNLSPRQFRDAQLLSFISETLERIGVPAPRLELEITEGILMEDQGGVEATLAQLKALGVRLVMDDFGTGYSSLSYLRSYPFDTLKVDRSFVRDITSDSADRELVNAAIALGHGLGLSVVAEGVETREQLQLLKKQGCDYAQGYLFSAPQRAGPITAMLQNAELD